MLIGAGYRREGLLCQYSAVETKGWGAANVAVVAVGVAHLTEIVEQYPAPADLSLGILLHALQLLCVYLLLAALIGKAPQGDDVLQVIIQHGLAGQAVPAATTYLLIEVLYALGHVVVHHKPHVALVYAHAEGYGGTYHLYVVVHKAVLHVVAQLIAHAGMIGCGNDARLGQLPCQLLGCLPGQTVDDAAVTGVTPYDFLYAAQLVPGSVAALHVQTQVRTVEGGHKGAGRWDVQLHQYVVFRHLVGGGGQGHDRNVGEMGLQLAHLRVLGTEIMPPTRYAVGLVYGKQ